MAQDSGQAGALSETHKVVTTDRGPVENARINALRARMLSDDDQRKVLNNLLNRSL